MPAPIAALAATTALSAGASAYSASRQAKSAKSAQEAQLAFEREKIEKWESVYGPTQENLAGYFNSLTPEYFAVQGLEAFQQEQQQALTNVREVLAQRGISTSGIAAQAELDFAQQGALGRAEIRATAPQKVAEQQLKFLQVGLGQDPTANLSQALAQRTATTQAQASQAAQVAGQSISSAIQTGGTALADYLRTPQPAIGANTAVGQQAFTTIDTGAQATFGL